MPEFLINGLSELRLSNEQYADMTDEMTDEILNVQADIVTAAQRRTASSMLRGRRYRGVIAASLGKDEVKPYKDGKIIIVQFKGNVVDYDHPNGERIAAIAYINEYGKTNQPARPFISTANEECAAEAIEASYEVIDKYI